MLDMDKLPQFVTFKTTGGFEIDYANKKSYHDVRAFIKESLASSVHVLNAESYAVAVKSGELWILLKIRRTKQLYKNPQTLANKKTYHDVRAFIKESLASSVHVLNAESYAAAVKSGELWIWCPPCLRLIGEYRTLHSLINKNDELLSKLKIGLIDCQKYSSICQQASVQSYPTSALYTPDGKVHKFVGHHAAATVLEMIDNALNPAVDELTPDQFVQLVEGRGSDETWVVDFFAPWCGPCQQLAPELQKAARALRAYDERVHVGSVDCQAYGQFCSKQGVNSYPSVRLYPAVNTKRRTQAYYPYPQNMWRNADTIQRWVFGMLPSIVTSLGNDYWTTVLDSDEPWIVDFYAPWCGHCVQFSPVYEQIAKVLDGKVKCAKVDCDQWPGVCQGAQVQAYPTVRFYKGRQGGRRQDVWGLQIQAQDKDTIVNVVESQLAQLHDEL
ncbi:unnamed protein product [Strongylus vulgaris]|uniref:Thioredoxin domain-containing protein n=1 Tax=Strongylus vulgaris TaxID=40348 RepID=A0A3P7LEU9_STRVU|nr:unnamed protein product [Strongylus vulgaris]